VHGGEEEEEEAERTGEKEMSRGEGVMKRKKERGGHM